MTIFDHLRQRIFIDRGMVPPPALDWQTYTQAQWSPEFEQLMRNRLIVGSLRYGSLGAKGKPSYRCTESIIKRIRKYDETGNLEMLVDVANLALIEYVESRHPLRHFGDAAAENEEHVDVER